MAKAKTVPKKEEPAMVAQAEPNHTEKIKSQVLAKIGKPPRLHRVEVCNHHNGKYRVNIWEQPEPDKSLAVTHCCPNLPVLLLDCVGDGRNYRQQPADDQVGLFRLNLPCLALWPTPVQTHLVCNDEFRGNRRRRHAGILRI